MSPLFSIGRLSALFTFYNLIRQSFVPDAFDLSQSKLKQSCLLFANLRQAIPPITLPEKTVIYQLSRSIAEKSVTNQKEMAWNTRWLEGQLVNRMMQDKLLWK